MGLKTWWQRVTSGRPSAPVPTPNPKAQMPIRIPPSLKAGDPYGPRIWMRAGGGAKLVSPSAIVNTPEGPALATATGLQLLKTMKPDVPQPKPQTPRAQSAPKSYEGNIRYFGSPEAYAEAIKTKLAQGIPLSDPAAARQFMADNPQLFAQRGPSSPSTLPTRPTTSTPPSTLPTRPTTSTPPSTLPTRPTTSTPPLPPPPVVIEEQLRQAEPDVNQTTQLLRDIQEVFNAGSQTPSGAALLQQWFNTQLMPAFAALEKQIQDMYGLQTSGIDPMTKAALESIRASADEQRRRLEEEMNRRGLLQSGIWIEAQTRLAKNQLTAEEQLLAGRLQQLTDRLSQVLLNLAQMRLKAIQDFGIEAVRAADQELLRRQQFALGLGQLATTLRGQDLATQRFYDNLAQSWAQFERNLAQDWAKFEQSEARRMLENQAQWSGVNPLTGQPTLDFMRFQAQAQYQQGLLQQGAERNRLLAEANKLKAEAQNARTAEDALFASIASLIWSDAANGVPREQAINQIVADAGKLPPRVVTRLFQEINRAYANTFYGVPMR